MTFHGSMQMCKVGATPVHCIEHLIWHPTQLVELFGSTRDAWMADDLDNWLAANEIYDGLPCHCTASEVAGGFLHRDHQAGEFLMEPEICGSMRAHPDCVP